MGCFVSSTKSLTILLSTLSSVATSGIVVVTSPTSSIDSARTTLAEFSTDGERSVPKTATE